ncbi:MAG: DnaA ATPase domain-containing protein [bacterium]
MPAPQQFTLAIEHPIEQRLDNFVSGENDELLQALRTPVQDFVGLWIYGQGSCGRSHLLRGRCLRAVELGESACYVSCADYEHNPGGLLAALEYAGRHGQVVALDDLEALPRQQEMHDAVMAIYQRVLNENGVLLVTHNTNSAQVNFLTPDLASRMRSLQHFHITPLDDAAKVRLLKQRAHQRGYALQQPVLDYWLARGPRSLGALLTDLETLDKASLVNKSPVTIPLLKQVLGY